MNGKKYSSAEKEEMHRDYYKNGESVNAYIENKKKIKIVV